MRNTIKGTNHHQLLRQLVLAEGLGHAMHGRDDVPVFRRMSVMTMPAPMTRPVLGPQPPEDA